MRSEGSERRATSSGWAEIGDYALIGDCRTAALIGRDGGVDWWCLPHFSGPAFFARILDRRRGGRFTIEPAERYRSKRSYLGDSNVLQTRFEAGGGELHLTDAMTIPPESGAAGLLPQRELLRSIEAVNAGIPVDVVFEPRPDYGRGKFRLTRHDNFGWACAYESHLLLLHTDLPLELAGDRRSLRGSFLLEPGEKRFFSVTYVRNDIGVLLPLGEPAAQRIADTVAWWERWSGQCTYDGPYRAAVVRSALATKLLTYCLSGAVVAAPTTSLPETIGGSRNWDYRYCWLRDASLTMEAFLDLGYRAEADAFMEWLLHSTRLTWPRLQVLYDVHGHSRVPESTLDHLEGYRGSRPVRVGNGAWNQLQLDVYGSLVMAAAAYMARGGEISREGYRMLAGFGRTVRREWRRPDHGIWEIRGETRHYTYSKVACWAALDCLAQVAREGGLSVPVEDLCRERDEIRDWIEGKGFDHDIGSYTGSFGSRDADASLLLMSRYRYCDADDPRMIGTFAYLESELASGALMYRYRGGFDRLKDDEHPFGICSFWVVDYLARAGRLEEATARFEALLGYCNDLGLYGEQIEAGTGAAMGNFPQAFTHVGLISAAVSLAEAGKQRGRGAGR